MRIQKILKELDIKQENGFSIYHNLEINDSVSKVYDAITQSDQLTNWWPLKCSGKPEKGNVYNFYFGPAYDWYGEVTQAIPENSFHVKMTKSDPDWETTSFGFDLEEKGENTLLQFCHIGWSHCNAHYKKSSFCWAMLLNGLKNYVEKGIIIPFQERE